MRHLSIILCLASNVAFSQVSYFVEYTNLKGVNIYDLVPEDDTLIALTGYIFSDPVANETSGLEYLQPSSGNILNQFNISDANKSVPFYLHSINNKIYSFKFDYSIPNNHKVKITIFDRLNSSSIDSISIPFNGNFANATWNVTHDSILVIGYFLGPQQGSWFTKIPLNDFPENVTLKIVSKLGPPANILKLQENANEYLIYSFTGLLYFNSDSGETFSVASNYLSVHGKTIHSIDSSHYISFGRLVDSTDLCLVMIDTALNVVKYTTFGMGANSYDYPAFTSCIDKDSQNYFVTAVINSSFNPYTNQTPKSYYVGKYNADLEAEWLHIFGGDRHFFISGVKADLEGGCYVYGFTRSNENNFQAIPFLMRLNSDGILTSTWDPGSTDFSLTIFGNPGTDAFRFHFNAADTNYTMQIHDMQGRLLSTMPISPGYNEMNTAHWPSGTYIYQLYHPSGTHIESGKWVKQ